MQQLTHHRASTEAAENPANRVMEARYSYYRRCQVFRRNGEQCKAPAEKGAQICHAHAAQQAMALRRDRERTAVLELAVTKMRQQGHTKCELATLLTSFKGIQVTLVVMMQALIDGRIDCKTAGRLGMHLQMMSKLLWTYHRGQKALTTKGAKEHEGSKSLPLINADNTDWKRLPKAVEANAGSLAANEREKARIVLVSVRFSAEHTELRPRAAYAEIGRVDEDTGTRSIAGERAYGDRNYVHSPPQLRAA